MQIFYTPDISGNQYIFSQDESKHIVKVLRLKNGDTIYQTDGRGTLYTSEITDASPKSCEVKLVNKKSRAKERGFYLHIAIAPTKNIKRFEWFLEKATEIGVDEITPLYCRYSERDHIRHDRLERVITSAMKQSLKLYHPKLNELTDYTDFINHETSASTFIALCDAQPKQHLKNALKMNRDVVIVVGPEGDFSTEEKQMSKDQGYEAVSISSSRLRTETAGVVACSIVNTMNEGDVESSQIT